MDFEIKKHVPLPENKGKPRKYNINLDSLLVNDHIHIPIPRKKIAQEIKIIRNFILRYVHKNPTTKFTARQMDGGVGIWRVKKYKSPSRRL